MTTEVLKGRQALVAATVLGVVAGTLGMAASFCFLCSRQQLDVIAGAAGFVAGAILCAGGLIAMTVVSRQSPEAMEAMFRLVRILQVFLLPLTALLACCVIYFEFFILGIALLLP